MLFKPNAEEFLNLSIGQLNLEIEKSVESSGPLGLVRIPPNCSLFIRVIDSGDDEYLFNESIKREVAVRSLLSYPIKIFIILTANLIPNYTRKNNDKSTSRDH